MELQFEMARHVACNDMEASIPVMKLEFVHVENSHGSELVTSEASEESEFTIKLSNRVGFAANPCTYFTILELIQDSNLQQQNSSVIEASRFDRVVVILLKIL